MPDTCNAHSSRQGTLHRDRPQTEGTMLAAVRHAEYGTVWPPKTKHIKNFADACLAAGVWAA